MTLRTTRQYAEVLVQGAGKLRVTRQVAEVLATGSGKARVSRQYVEYLISNTAPPSGIHNVAAADALTFTDTAHLTPIPCKIQDALNLADSNLCNGTKRNRAIDSLNLRDTSVGTRTSPKLCSAADSLSLGQLVNVNLCQVAFIELALADTAMSRRPSTSSMPWRLRTRPAGTSSWRAGGRDTLSLTDLAPGYVRATIHNVTAQSQLMLADQAAITAHVVHKPRCRVSTSWPRCRIRRPASGRFTPRPATRCRRPTTAMIRLPEQSRTSSGSRMWPRPPWCRPAPHGRPPVVVRRAGRRDRDSRGGDPCRGVRHPGVHVCGDSESGARGGQSLLFADAASAVAVKAIRDALTLGDVAQVAGVRNFSATSLLSLEEAVAFIVVRRDWEWRYHPFIGTLRSGSPPATLVWSPVAGLAAGTLVYPAAPPYSDWLTLRSPDLGNKDRLQFNRISRETRGGTLIVFADPLGPKSRCKCSASAGSTRPRPAASWTL